MGSQLFFVRIGGHSTVVPCFYLRRNEAQGRTAMCCVSYGTVQASCNGWGGISLFAPLFAHSFVRSIYIMSYTLTAAGGGGVSYWQEVRRMELRWALARSLLRRGSGRGALYPSPKRNEEYKTTHI